MTSLNLKIRIWEICGHVLKINVSWNHIKNGLLIAITAYASVTKRTNYRTDTLVYIKLLQIYHRISEKQ